jgi:uncharacterized protein YeeX (DUF496 family)
MSDAGSSQSSKNQNQTQHNDDTKSLSLEISNLGTIVQEWRRLHEEISDTNQQIREKKKRVKILEEIVLKTMKVNNIGTLDLKNSGGRILYNKKNAKEGLNAKTIQKLLAEHMKSEEKAAEALKYINEHRESKTRENLLYEKE